MSNIKERLRSMVQKMRRTPVPIIDLVPMFQEAADHIAALEAESAANLQRALAAENELEMYQAEDYNRQIGGF